MFILGYPEVSDRTGGFVSLLARCFSVCITVFGRNDYRVIQAINRDQIWNQQIPSR